MYIFIKSALMLSLYSDTYREEVISSILKGSARCVNWSLKALGSVIDERFPGVKKYINVTEWQIQTNESESERERESKQKSYMTTMLGWWERDSSFK